MAVFEALPWDLSHILGLIQNRNLALLDFQRDFVWDPSGVEDLITSVALSYPAGSLLFLRQGGEPYFAMRHFEGAPPLEGHISPHLVLDGQQRLTSLYQAFYGAGEHLYFLHLDSLLARGDFEAALEHLPRGRARRMNTIEDQASQFVLPLRVIHGQPGGFIAWRDAVLDLEDDAEARRARRDELNRVHETWIKNMEQYKFPVVTLPPETGLEPVCKIFETLNRTGVRLGVFELLTARFYPSGVRLRELWESARVDYQILEEFDIDPYYILQIVALLAGAPGCRRSDVLGLTVESINDNWLEAVDGLAESLRLLQSDCGVYTPSWLPYYPMLLPLAAVWKTVRELTGPARGSARSRIIRWFWCSALSQSYEQGANAKAQTDFHDLMNWIAGGDPPQVVTEFKFEPDSLAEVTPRQRATYRAVMALILRRGTRDFHGLSPLDARALRERRVNDHHVFPQAYLESSWPAVSATTRDSILNRALIDPLTNSRIGARPPSQYLNDMMQEFGDQQLDELLASHLLPTGAQSPLRLDDFETFVEDRKGMIAAEIRVATQQGH